MNTESIQCRKVDTIEKVGDFAFDAEFEYLYVWLPGSTGPDAIPITLEPYAGRREWTWDGNVKQPTLTPSILSPNVWHGYLTRGRLESCR